MKMKIKAKWVIKLPKGSEVLVKKGEVVTDGQLLAKVLSKKIESFDYSLLLKKINPKKIEELNQNFMGNRVSKGDLLCISGSFVKNKICFPIEGNFLEVDEFGNLKIEVIEGKEREIVAPVRSVVSKIDDEKITLDFEAREIKGIGLVEGKAWGKTDFVLSNDLKQLDSEFKGKIIFTDRLDKPFLLKAEVVGITGLITNLKTSEDIDSNLPILLIEEDDWKMLLSKDKIDQKVLINSRLGRLLLVVE